MASVVAEAVLTSKVEEEKKIIRGNLKLQKVMEKVKLEMKKNENSRQRLRSEQNTAKILNDELGQSQKLLRKIEHFQEREKVQKSRRAALRKFYKEQLEILDEESDEARDDSESESDDDEMVSVN